MSENTAAEPKPTNRGTNDFVAIAAPRLGVLRRENRLWVIDPGHTEARRREGIQMRALAPLLVVIVLLPVAGGILYALLTRSIARYTQTVAEQPSFYEQGFGDGLLRQATAAALILVVFCAGVGLLISLPTITPWLMDVIAPRALRLPHGFCTRLGSISWFRAVDRDNPAAPLIHRALWKVARIEEARTRAHVDLGSPTGRDVIAVWDDVAADLERLRETYVDWNPEPTTRAQLGPREEPRDTDPRTLELLNLIEAARDEQGTR